MANLFANVAQVFRGRVSTPPQFFDIRCSCGGKISGERTATHQLVPCPGCRQKLLVFPATVYPLVRKPVTEPPPRRPAEPGQRVKSGSGPTTVVAPRVERRPSMRDSLHAQSALVRKFLADRWLAFRRAFLTPLKLSLLVMLLMAVGTGWWLMYLKQRHDAEAIVTEQIRLASEALVSRNLLETANAYAAAVPPLDFLGRQDSQARRIRQQSREFAALTGLATGSPQDMLKDAIKFSSGKGPLAWPEMFRATYLDSWLVCDVVVSRDDVSGDYRFDLPIVVGDQQALVAGKFPALEVIPVDRFPARVVLAGQVENLEAIAGSPGDWGLRLVPQSVFLWADIESLKHLGFFDSDESLASIQPMLETQTQWLGLTTETATPAAPGDP